MFHQIMTWFLNMCFLLIDILKLYNLMYRKVSVLHNKFKQVRWNIKSQSMSNYQQDLSNLVYVKFCICRILYMSNFTMSYFEFHRVSKLKFLLYFQGFKKKKLKMARSQKETSPKWMLAQVGMRVVTETLCTKSEVL